MNEGIVTSSDYKLGKDGRKYPAKRFHMGQKEEQIQEASYKGNIGVMELAKFHSSASAADKSKFTELMKKKAAASSEKEEKQMSSQIWDHVQKVTGTKLHQMENTMLSFKDILESKDDFILQSLADKDINASIKDGKVHIHDHSQHRKAQTMVKRMGMPHEVVKAPKQTNESTESNDAWKSQRSNYDGPGKGDLLGNMSKEQHQSAIKYHQDLAAKLIKGNAKYSDILDPKQVQDQVTKHDTHAKQHEDALKSLEGHGFEKGHDVTFYHSKHLPALPGKVTKATPEEVHIKTDKNEFIVHPKLVKAKASGQAGVVVKKTAVKEDTSQTVSEAMPTHEFNKLVRGYLNHKKAAKNGGFKPLSMDQYKRTSVKALATAPIKEDNLDELSKETLDSYSKKAEGKSKPGKDWQRLSGLLRAQMKKKKIEEAGPFSYGAKTPKKGSSAYENMMRNKKSYYKDPAPEIKDEMVGTARKSKKETNEASIIVPTLKPRDPNHKILAMKKNAGGAHRDKKKEMKKGDGKHKGRMFEETNEE